MGKWVGKIGPVNGATMVDFDPNELDQWLAENRGKEVQLDDITPLSRLTKTDRNNLVGNLIKQGVVKSVFIDTIKVL